MALPAYSNSIRSSPPVSLEDSDIVWESGMSGARPMKMIVLFRRKQELTLEQFREHYERRHAPLAMQLFPYLREYVRNYIRRDVAHQRAGGEAMAASLDFDVITEITFDSKDDYDRMVRAMADPVIREQVVEDEKRFLDRSATVVFLVDEERDCK
jgi:uncharacterized protein (TIGR02118 family)